VDSDVEGIARIAWGANLALQVRDGEELPDEPWDAAPRVRRKACMFTVWQIMIGRAATPEQAHDAWTEYLTSRGWEYGEVKDPGERKHPSLRPWNELTARQQLAQRLNVHIVHEIMQSQETVVE
jgi:hypothetical protein